MSLSNVLIFCLVRASVSGKSYQFTTDTSFSIYLRAHNPSMDTSLVVDVLRKQLTELDSSCDAVAPVGHGMFMTKCDIEVANRLLLSSVIDLPNGTQGPLRFGVFVFARALFIESVPQSMTAAQVPSLLQQALDLTTSEFSLTSSQPDSEGDWQILVFNEAKFRQCVSKQTLDVGGRTIFVAENKRPRVVCGPIPPHLFNVDVLQATPWAQADVVFIQLLGTDPCRALLVLKTAEARDRLLNTGACTYQLATR